MRAALLLLLLVGACDGSCASMSLPGGGLGTGIGGRDGFDKDRSRRAAVVITDLYNRTFANPIYALPTCTAGTNCEMQCTVSGSNWSCVDENGSAIGVTQGTGVVTFTDPFGKTSFDEVTDARSPSLTSSFLAENAAHTIVMTGYSSARDFSTHFPLSIDGDVSDVSWRQEGANLHVYAGGYDASVGFGPLYGWGMYSTRANTDGTSWTTRASRSENTDVVGAWVDNTSNSWLFGKGYGGCVAGCAMRGPLESFTVFSTEKSSADLLTLENAWAGIPDDSDNPIEFERTGTAFAVINGRAAPFAENTPFVSSRGLEIDVGGSENTASGSGWANASTDASSWDAIGTPTVTTNTTAGPFAEYIGGYGYTEGDLIEDNDNGAYEGYTAPLNCGDAPLTGDYTASCWVRSGTAGTTTTEVTIGVTTDGTGSTECAFTGLTTTWERKECMASLSGTITTIKGRIRVGNAAADTGSVIVSHCQCDAQPFAARERVNATASAETVWEIPADEAVTWPTGESVGGEVEVVFALDHDHPTNADFYEYIIDALNVDTDDHWMAITLSYTDKNTAPKIRAVLRPDNSVPVIGDQSDTDTYSDDLATLEAGQFYIVRFRYMPAGSIGGYARVRHYIYFDECADVTTCEATTLVGSDTTGTKFAAIDAPANHAALGWRVYGSVGYMDGAIARVRVSEVQ